MWVFPKANGPQNASSKLKLKQISELNGHNFRPTIKEGKAEIRFPYFDVNPKVNRSGSKCLDLHFN
jgi:hypothetical protein